MIPIETLYDHARTMQALHRCLSAAVTDLGDGGAVDLNTPMQTKFVYVIPWNGPTADSKHSIHADARHYETALIVTLFGRAKFRGLSDDNMLRANGRLLFDEALPGEQPWTEVPGDLRCPHCNNRLELQPGWQHHPEQTDVCCRRCKDESGQILR
ncbi:hypothetical protein V5R04_07675 [Jonesiaceae bacterium BS-20]|uniref:Uncharacterized protein n=1 Tax=Jonesiaceae bacterium BS-20 TaxID=3120821 RepID=A0AAU7E0I2_9MICO